VSSAIVIRVALVSITSRRPATRVREEILTLVERALAGLVRRRFRSDSRLDEAVKRVQSGEEDPYSAAEAILDTFELAE